MVSSSESSVSIRSFLLSIFVVLSVATSWALHTQFQHSALHIDPERFRAPYFMIWFNTNFMILCYPFHALLETIRGKSMKETFSHASEVLGPKGLTPFTLFTKVGPFLLYWLGANYTYARCLLYVSSSIATSISACNAAIVYFLAILVLGDGFVPIKLLSVLFAICGVAVISIGMRGINSTNDQWIGILLAVMSATSAAVYKVFFKKVVGKATFGQVSLFMSCLGCLNLLFNFVPPLVLGILEIEKIDIAWAPWGILCIAAVLTLAFNFLINLGIALLHPLVISVGMLLGIPLNTVIDILFRGVYPSVSFYIGTSLICVSFILIIFPYELVFKPNLLISPLNRSKKPQQVPEVTISPSSEPEEPSQEMSELNMFVPRSKVSSSGSSVYQHYPYDNISKNLGLYNFIMQGVHFFGLTIENICSFTGLFYMIFLRRKRPLMTPLDSGSSGVIQEIFGRIQ